MKLTTIRSKIIGLVVGSSLSISMLLAFYAPQQAKKIGHEILQNEAEFVTDLVVQSTAVGLQTMSLTDDDTALRETLGLLTSEQSESAVITDAWIYDSDLKMITGMNGGTTGHIKDQAVNELKIMDRGEVLQAVSPVWDAQKNILGYVEINFSKKFLNQQVSANSTTSLLMALGIVAIMAIIGMWFGSYVGKRISYIAEIAEQISMGNVEQDLKIRSNDEIGKLADSFRKLIDYIKGIAECAEQVSKNDLSVSVEAKSREDILSNSFNRMITNFNSVMGQMSSNATQFASSAIEATDASKNASETATIGGQIVSDTVERMRIIASVVDESAKSIAKLAQSTDEVGQIISVIDNIARQTNLLALNAAVEAARAGQHGLGFAVVADEVRQLALRTGTATSEITDMIKGIQEETKEVERSMEIGMQEVNTGREMADKAGGSLKKVVDMSQQVMDMIQQIAAAAEEQSIFAEQITQNGQNGKKASSVTEKSATRVEGGRMLEMAGRF